MYEKYRRISPASLRKILDGDPVETVKTSVVIKGVEIHLPFAEFRHVVRISERYGVSLEEAYQIRQDKMIRAEEALRNLYGNY